MATPAERAVVTSAPMPVRRGRGASVFSSALAGVLAARSASAQIVEVTAPDHRLMPAPTSAREPAPATADSRRAKPITFGDRGQFALLAGSTVGISSSSYSRGAADSFAIVFAPSLEWFVFDDVSVGLEIDVARSSSHGYVGAALLSSKYTLIGGGVHFGLNLPFAKIASVYPLLMAGIVHSERTYALPGDASSPFVPDRSATALTENGLWIAASVPVLYHPVEHFFVGLGPTLYHDFSHAEGGWGGGDGAKRTSIGGEFVLGGYFEPSAAEPADTDEVAPASGQPKKKPPRFGDAGTLVLTEESAVSWQSVSYQGLDSSRNSFEIAGGFDWFFFRDQSLGFAAAYSDIHRQAFPPAPVASSGQSFGALVRYGFVLPFYSWFSVYPRMTFSYSVAKTVVSADIVSAATTIQTHEHIVAAAITVPAMFHLATHFFVGLGPSVSEDIVHTQEHGPQTRRVAYGASTLLGGWL